MVLVRDILTAFKHPKMPSLEQIKYHVDDHLKYLTGAQNSDGGFGFWYNGERSWPYLTCHVGHAVARAAQKGYVVPQSLKDGLVKYLRGINSYTTEWRYSWHSSTTIQAYALYVASLPLFSDTNIVTPEKVRGVIAGWRAGWAVWWNDRHTNDTNLHTDAMNIPFEAIGWLLPALKKAGCQTEIDEMLMRVNNNVRETAGKAYFVDEYTEGWYYCLLWSPGRVNALLLDALLNFDDENSLDLVRPSLHPIMLTYWNVVLLVVPNSVENYSLV